MKHKFLSAVAAAFCGFFLCVHSVDAQGTAFTYQGSLDINGLPANGYYDFEFTLFGQSVLGSPASPTLTNANVLVTGGLFTTTLDFGADILAVTNNYLDIAVCTNGSDAFVELSPRQLLTTAPYAATALTAANLAGVLANNSVQPGAAAATISGGSGNVIQSSANGATIGGGTQNVIETNNDYSTVSGGGGNTIEDGSFYSSIAGGFGNTVQGNASGCAIAGTDNSIDFGAYSSVIGGGEHNEINANSAGCAIAGGGYGAIGFGVNFGTIAGGYGNVILDGAGFAALGGGRQNTNEGNYSTIPGGSQNVAGGDYSFAAGLQAKALHQGSFVWADAEASPFSSTAADQFLVRASGGVGINMNNPGGASLYAQGNRAGGSFSDAVSIFENTSAATGTSGSGPALRVVVDGGSCPAGALSVSDNGSGPIAEFGNSLSFVASVENDGTIKSKGVALTSDRNAKENFAALDARAILAKVAGLSVTEWNYKDDSTSKKHIGPVAQDFQAAFGLNGDDDKHISVVDEGGVAIAAIQGLNKKVDERDATIQRQSAEISELKGRLERLERLVNQKLSAAAF